MSQEELDRLIRAYAANRRNRMDAEDTALRAKAAMQGAAERLASADAILRAALEQSRGGSELPMEETREYAAAAKAHGSAQAHLSLSERLAEQLGNLEAGTLQALTSALPKEQKGAGV